MRNLILIFLAFSMSSCVKYGCVKGCMSDMFAYNPDLQGITAWKMSYIRDSCSDEISTNLGIVISYYKTETFDDAEVWTNPRGYENNFPCVKKGYQTLSILGTTHDPSLSLWGIHDKVCITGDHFKFEKCKRFKEDLRMYSFLKFKKNTKKELLKAREGIYQNLKKCVKAPHDTSRLSIKLLISKEGKVKHFYDIRNDHQNCIGVIGKEVKFPTSDRPYIQEFSFKQI